MEKRNTNEKIWKWGSLLLILVLSLFIFSDNMTAQIHEDDHVKIQMHLEQNTDNEKEIIVHIAITNIGMSAIENVEITNILPDGIHLTDDVETDAIINSIAPGMTEEFTLHTSTGFALNLNLIILIFIGVIAVGLIVALVILILRYVKSQKAAVALLLCLILGASPILQPITAVAAKRETTTVEFEESIDVGKKNYAFKTTVSYTTLPAIEAEGEELTRRQWLSEILSYFGLEDDFDSNLILMTYAQNFFPEDESETPRLDDVATREFAAVTIVNFLGFLPVRDIICDDANEITYLQDVESAVALDLFRLDNNCFYPNNPLTRSEADHALEVMVDILSTIEDFEEDDEIEAGGELVYLEDVVHVDEDIQIDIMDDTLIMEADSDLEDLQVDDIIVLPDQTPYKIIEITIDDDEYILETTTPEIHEVLSSIDVYGTGTVNAETFLPSENLSSFDSSKYINDLHVDVKGSLDGPGKVSFETKKELTDYMELFAEVNMELPAVKYKADVDFGWFSINVKNAYLKICPVVEIGGGIKASTDEDDVNSDNKLYKWFSTPYRPSGNFNNLVKADDGLITLGKLPVVGVPGVCAFVEVGLKYKIEGQVGLVYTIDGTLGVQVTNNRVRSITDLNGNLDFKAIEASAKLGPEIGALLEICSTWSLIDFYVSAGAAGKGSLIVRDTENSCINASIYLFGDFEAMKKSIINNIVDVSYKLEFWNDKSSPVKLGIHLENLAIVDECTFEGRTLGTLTGLVADATDRTQVIPNATINIVKDGELTPMETLNTDASGNYSLTLSEGDYTIIVSAPGYISFTTDVCVTPAENQYVETLLMIDEEYKDTTASASGSVINAVTGAGVDGVTITVRKGWNETNASVLQTITTDSSGNFTIEGEAGNYTLYMEKEGFISNTINITLITENSESITGNLVPEGTSLPGGDLRMVLTWGSTPSDLDSHLIGPTSDNSSYFHVYYSSKNYYSNGETYADLDLDDTTSYGPETTTVYNMNATGTYSFYVHDYSNGYSTSSTEMSNSGAKILVYAGETLVMTYIVPPGRPGTLWHVFNYDAATRTITTVNEFVSDYDYSYWY